MPTAGKRLRSFPFRKFLVLLCLIVFGCGVTGPETGSDSLTPTPVPATPPDNVSPTPTISPTPTPTPNNPEPVLPISVVIQASRINGVAPLGVFFDATQTTGLSQNDYVAAAFEWDFGDPASGSWSTDSQNKNSATGFLAAHAFENPGTYTVTVKVKDRRGNTGQGSLSIIVTNFSGTTYYISALSGSDANDGLSPDSQTPGHGPWQTLQMIETTAGDDPSPIYLSSGNVRILLKRGETFPIWESGTIKLLDVNPTGSPAQGPVILGAYGEGPRPVIWDNISVDGTAIELTHNCHDVRIMDLELAGPYVWGEPQSGETQYAVFTGEDVSDVLLLRLNIHNHEYGVLWGETPAKNLFLTDCQVHHNAIINYGSNTGTGLAVLGNRIEDSFVSHNVYSYFVEKYYIAHNTFTRPGWNPRECEKPTDGKFYSNRSNLRLALDGYSCKDVVITDNRCVDGSSKIEVGLMDSSSVNHDYTNVLIERNRTENPTNAFWITAGIVLDSVNHGVVRNNVLLRGPEGESDCFLTLDNYAGRNPACLPTRNLEILENSAFSSYQGPKESETRFLAMWRADADNLTVENNAVSILPVSGIQYTNLAYDLPDGFPLTRLTSNGNLWNLPDSPVLVKQLNHAFTLSDWQATGHDVLSVAADPLFIDPGNGNLHLMTQAGGFTRDSPGIDAGVSVPIFEDYDRTSRPTAKSWDIGAFETGSSGSQPVARLLVLPLVGPSPLTIHFDASQSTAAEGTQIASYELDMDDTGVFKSARIAGDYMYLAQDQDRTCNIRLRVTDSLGRTDNTTVPVVVTVPHTISGGVYLQNYSRQLTAEPIRIELRNWTGTRQTRDVSLDADGNYTLSGIESGTYDLAFEKVFFYVPF